MQKKLAISFRSEKKIQENINVHKLITELDTSINVSVETTGAIQEFIIIHDFKLLKIYEIISTQRG